MAATISSLPYVAQMAVERLDRKRQKFVLAFFKSYDIKLACAEANIQKKVGEQWRDEPEIVTALKMIREASSRTTGVTYEYLIGMQRELLERCMQHRPVVDSKGKKLEGEWTFDPYNANKGIENLAKMTGHINNAGTSVTVNVANLNGNQRANELSRLLSTLDARKNAGSVIDAEYKELPAPETCHEEPLFD